MRPYIASHGGDVSLVKIENNIVFINTSVKTGETHKKYITRLNKELENYLQEHPEAYLIGLFGVGYDGHTAGIFPKQTKSEFEKIYHSDNYFIGINEPDNEFHKRVTLTPSFIHESIAEVILFAAGKQETLMTLSFTERVHQFPALLLTKHKHCSLFTDAEIPAFI